MNILIAFGRIFTAIINLVVIAVIVCINHMLYTVWEDSTKIIIATVICIFAIALDIAIWVSFDKTLKASTS